MSEILRTLTDRKLAAKGHLVLPGGIIVNWGTIAAAGNDASVVDTFDKPFTTAYMCAIVNAYVGSSAGAGAGSGSYNFNGLDSKAQIRLVGSLLQPCTFAYVVIGI